MWVVLDTLFDRDETVRLSWPDQRAHDACKVRAVCGTGRPGGQPPRLTWRFLYAPNQLYGHSCVNGEAARVVLDAESQAPRFMFNGGM